jgi:radical SAM superfamily enzyme YgiQ (UPF0313 family)
MSPSETFLYQPVVPHPEAVRVGFFYPAPYTVAMSSLGYLMLFQRLDQNPDAAVQRITMDSLTEAHPSDFELMGFSFSFELDITSILKTLDHYQMPYYAADREGSFPLMFAGGPVVMSNPEPFAPFFDFFLIGDGEGLFENLIATFKHIRHSMTKEEQLRYLATHVPGVYVPSLYEVCYEPGAEITDIQPKYPDIPFPVEKWMAPDLENNVAYSPILTEQAYFSNMFLLEVMRGCAHRCRFCLASYTTLPARGPYLPKLIEAVELGLKHTRKIGLLGALISDHPQFPELCAYLNQQENVVLSASSLRADTLTPAIAETFKKGQQNQLTIAVETGSERLRRRINKNLKHEQILNAARAMATSGLKSMKLYGMVGLPDETEDDVSQLAELLFAIKKETPKLQLNLGCSTFVPKGGTPFQWQARLKTGELKKRHEQLRKRIYKIADFRPSSPKWDTLQAWISRGDRRLAPVLVEFYRAGGNLGAINKAYKEVQQQVSGHKDRIPSVEWYAERERPAHEVLPWEMISLGVDKAILYKEGLPPPGFSLS